MRVLVVGLCSVMVQSKAFMAPPKVEAPPKVDEAVPKGNEEVEVRKEVTVRDGDDSSRDHFGDDYEIGENADYGYGDFDEDEDEDFENYDNFEDYDDLALLERKNMAEEESLDSIDRYDRVMKTMSSGGLMNQVQGMAAHAAHHVNKVSNGMSYQAFDKDDSRAIDLNEFVTQCKEMFLGLTSVSEEEFGVKALELYNKIDENKDRSVSQEEFARAGPKMTLFLIANMHLVL